MISINNQDLKKTLEFVKNVVAHKHIAFFYTSDDRRIQVLYNFVKGGLERNMGVCYISFKESAEEIISAMWDFGIDAANFERRASLIITNWEKVTLGKTPDPNDIMRTLNSVADRFLKSGKAGCRICSDMNYFTEKKMKDKLLDLEFVIHSRSELGVTLLSAYDYNKIVELDEGQLLIYLLEIHEYAIINGPDINILKTPDESI